jgi:hypothetical protein
MKKISTLLLAAILVATIGQAQTYNVTTNKTWSSSYPTSCNNCTFNISNGVMLTIDRNITLQNAKFIGGNITVNNNTINLQTSGGGKTYFTNTNVVVNNASSITASSPAYITNSVFTFNGTSKFTTQNLLEMTNSRLNFYGNANYLATGGPVNLKANSMMVAGDGLLSSRAYLYFNGPLLSVFDNSALIVANNNNYYFNWSPYFAADLFRLNFTTSNNKNCGTGFPNSCSMPVVYGPVNLMPSGLSVGNSLPVVLSDFSVRLNNSQVELSWTTDMESNSARFEVERSTDGVKWTTIATITAKGNSSIVTKYASVDKTPAAGINYYRLKMVDLDNTHDFSEVKSIKTIASANVRVYPNPAKDVVNISLPATAALVRFLNTAGQILQERKSVNGNSTISIDVTNYNAGTYMVQVINTDGTSRNNVLLIAK